MGAARPAARADPSRTRASRIVVYFGALNPSIRALGRADPPWWSVTVRHILRGRTPSNLTTTEIRDRRFISDTRDLLPLQRALDDNLSGRVVLSGENTELTAVGTALAFQPEGWAPGSLGIPAGTVSDRAFTPCAHSWSSSPLLVTTDAVLEAALYEDLARQPEASRRPCGVSDRCKPVRACCEEGDALDGVRH